MLSEDKTRVLLVDDDEDDYILARDTVLEIRGTEFSLDWAETFQKGLVLMKQNLHDVYLIDYRLGSRDGIELLREATAAGCQSPVILLTGQDEHEIDVAAMKAGAADYLVKSQLKPDMLERSIRYAVERRRAAAAAAFDHGRITAFGTQIGLTLARKQTLDGILSACADTMLNYLNAKCAQLFIFDADKQRFEPADFAPVLKNKVENTSVVKLLNVKELAQGKPVLIRNLPEHSKAVDDRLAALGASFIAYPLLLEDRLVGAMTLFSQTPLCDSILQELASVANGIALCIDRHQSKKALDYSKAKYQKVVENIREVIFQVDQIGNWTFLNPAWEEITGFQIQDTIGTPFLEYVQHNERDRNRNYLLQLMDRKLSFARYETQFIKKDGSACWVEIFMQLFCDHSDSIMGATGTLTDITDRKEAEVQIQKLAAFPRFNPNPVLEFSAEGELTYHNDAAQSLVQFLGKETPLNLLPPDFGNIVKGCMAFGRNQPHHQVLIDGKTISWSFFPIATAKVVHCYGTDITEHLNLEAQFRHAQKLESVGQLAAGIAHDFNNVLTVIQGYVDLILQKDDYPESTNKALKCISSAAHRATSLTRQLLMFSHKQVIQTKVIDLNSILKGLENMLPRLLGEHITLSLSMLQSLPCIEADSGMVEQVIMNMAVNARDAMPKGGKLLVETSQVKFEEQPSSGHPKRRHGHFICLTISDNGSGMSAETQDRIFEPFFTTKQVGKGTGLGLATAYGIVNQHRGWIEVVSQLGAGTTFKIFLPLSTKKAPESAQGATTLSPIKSGRGERILFAEDEADLRILTRDTLRQCGYDVVDAQNGIEALQLWDSSSRSFDMLLTDIVMPEGLSGFELAEQIKKRTPDLKVIYTSGYSPETSEKELADKFFLSKPYSLQELVANVRKCLDQRAAPELEADKEVLQSETCLQSCV